MLGYGKKRGAGFQPLSAPRPQPNRPSAQPVRASRAPRAGLWERPQTGARPAHPSAHDPPKRRRPRQDNVHSRDPVSCRVRSRGTRRGGRADARGDHPRTGAGWRSSCPFLADLATLWHRCPLADRDGGARGEALEEGRDLNDDVTVLDATTALGYVALAKGELRHRGRMFAEALELTRSLTGHDTAGMQPRDRQSFASATSHVAFAPGRHPAPARTLGVTWLGLRALEAAADWLGAAGRSEPAVTCWGTIDAVRSRTLDRTGGNDMGIFEHSRERDREALDPEPGRRRRPRAGR